MLVKVKDSNFIRDTDSMALINQDTAARDEYYSKVKMIHNHREEINKVNNEISSLKDELSEIKNLLLKITEK
jgi:myo-inositol catabolism protein IolC